VWKITKPINFSIYFKALGPRKMPTKERHIAMMGYRSVGEFSQKVPPEALTLLLLALVIA